MSAKRSASHSGLGAGLATLVTIMVAVLLTTFSVLTLVSARADLRLSTKAVESSQNYYAADSQAEKWLAEVDGFVTQGHADLAADLSAAGYQVISSENGGGAVGGEQGGSTGSASATNTANAGSASTSGANATNAASAAPNVPAADDRVRITKSFAIDGNRNLVVELAIDNNGKIDILKWQTTVKRPAGATG